MEVIQGIYKITNKINNNSYIGKSVDIYNRWRTHKNTAFNASPNNVQYEYALYRAIRKYGIDNFEMSIIEVVADASTLNDREQFWIAYFDTFNNGYNETEGGDGITGRSGEKHINHKLTMSDVIDIRVRWASCTESVRDIFVDYDQKIHKTGFKKIYTWQTWKNVLPELNTVKNREWHKHNSLAFSNPGNMNPRAILTDSQVIDIRKRYQLGEKIKDIYEDYKYTGITLGSFYASALGKNRKYLN